MGLGCEGAVAVPVDGLAAGRDVGCAGICAGLGVDAWRTGSGAGTRAWLLPPSTGAGPRASLMVPLPPAPARSSADSWAAEPHTGQTGSMCAVSDDVVDDNSHS